MLAAADVPLRPFPNPLVPPGGLPRRLAIFKALFAKSQTRLFEKNDVHS